MVRTDRILIVGAGIAGLSAAIALRQRGWSPELVEAKPDWPVQGAAITMHANGVRALRSLGVDIAADGAEVPRWIFLSAVGDELCSTDLRALWGDVGACVGVTRVRLQRALVSAAAETTSRRGVAVTGLADGIDGVRVSFDDGTSADYALVVGADGINSTVRRTVDASVTPQYSGTMAWRSIVPARPDGVDRLMVLMGDGCFFGLVPVEDGGTYGFAGLSHDEFVEPTDGRRERFRARFDAFGGPVPSYLAALERDDQIHCGPVEWVDMDRWHHGRVVLIGDAAHAAPPHMGEGGSLAIEDAIVLADELDASVERGDDIASALGVYEQRRRPRVEWVQAQSRAAAAAWVLPAAVRDNVLRDRGDQMLRERYRPLIDLP